jgi:hypothetical protein
MPMIKSQSLFRLAAVVATGLLVAGLGGCGRKNDPVVAGSRAPAAAPASPVGIPVGPVVRPPEPKPAPKGGFVLDPLL